MWRLLEVTGIRGNKLHFSRVVRMGIIEKASESWADSKAVIEFHKQIPGKWCSKKKRPPFQRLRDREDMDGAGADRVKSQVVEGTTEVTGRLVSTGRTWALLWEKWSQRPPCWIHHCTHVHANITLILHAGHTVELLCRGTLSQGLPRNLVETVTAALLSEAPPVQSCFLSALFSQVASLRLSLRLSLPTLLSPPSSS